VRQVRITLPTAAVLRQMLENPTADYYGFALAETTSFPSGTIYPILARLETAGWLASFWEHGDPAPALVLVIFAGVLALLGLACDRGRRVYALAYADRFVALAAVLLGRPRGPLTRVTSAGP
jgi:hypothetical protein